MSTHSLWDNSILQFVLGVAISTLFINHIQSRVKSFWLYSILALPGTIAHELSHLLVGYLFNGQPRSFSLWPKIEGRHITLGSVSFANIHSINAVPIALAPLLLLLLPVVAHRLSLHQDWGVLSTGLACVILGLVCSSSLPSAKDLKVMLSRPLGIIFWCSVTYYLLISP